MFKCLTLSKYRFFEGMIHFMYHITVFWKISGKTFPSENMKLHQNQNLQRNHGFCWNIYLALKEEFLPYYFIFISSCNLSKLGSEECGMTHLPLCSPPDCGSAGTSILPTIFSLSSSGNLTYYKLLAVQKIFGYSVQNHKRIETGIMITIQLH